MLLQSKKEHVLHGDMGPDDVSSFPLAVDCEPGADLSSQVFFYYTTPGWVRLPLCFL